MLWVLVPLVRFVTEWCELKPDVQNEKFFLKLLHPDRSGPPCHDWHFEVLNILQHTLKNQKVRWIFVPKMRERPCTDGLLRSNLMLQDQSAGNCCLKKGQNVKTLIKLLITNLRNILNCRKPQLGRKFKTISGSGLSLAAPAAEIKSNLWWSQTNL